MDSYHIAKIAEAIGDPSRTLMLSRLMDGRAYTVTELSRVAGVGASTASAHLSRLLEAGLVTKVKQGRFIYYRLKDYRVAEAIESLAQLEPLQYQRRHVPKKMHNLIQGRSCYDHLAGQLGVALFQGMLEREMIALNNDVATLTTYGKKKIQDLDIPLQLPNQTNQPLVKACLDWTERCYHLSGIVGKNIMTYCFAKRWILRRDESRAVLLSSEGKGRLQEHFGVLDFLEKRKELKVLS